MMNRFWNRWRITVGTFPRGATATDETPIDFREKTHLPIKLRTLIIIFGLTYFELMVCYSADIAHHSPKHIVACAVLVKTFALVEI